METSKRHVIHLDRYIPMDQALRTMETPSADGIIHVRVDWDGAGGSLGTFQVRNLDGGWDDVGNLSPSSPINDVFFARPGPSVRIVNLHIQRGPMHGAIPFEAWARSIQWIQNPPPVLGSLPETFSAVRENDYQYSGTEYQIQTSMLEDGIQTAKLSLDLDKGDYELWVKLRHPTDVTCWSSLDPIVGHGDRNGTPGGGKRVSGTAGDRPGGAPATP
jgi:hypothetical protein